MGRLGPLNSLAFGRSPFESPELDMNGDFILGPHAHDLENNDYVQQFDNRGHPKNDSSKATIRAMQHAQNAVLETVGVVVRREVEAKSAWQRQSRRDKMDDIINENSHGILIREIGPFLLQSSVWWVISLRRRMQTFRSYLGPPVSHVIRSEARTTGLLSFLTDGLLPAIASYLLNIVLIGMQNRALESTFKISLPGTNYSWKPCTSLAELAVALIVFPAKAFSILQSLHLIPSTFYLSPWSFVPFVDAAPVQLPPTPSVWSTGTGVAFLTSLCYHPFLVSTVSDMTKTYIHNATYRVILLTLTPKPDRPDKLTLNAAKRDHDNDSLSLPGIGQDNSTERLSQARTDDFWTEIGRELGFLAARLKQFQSLFSRKSPPIDEVETVTEHLETLAEHLRSREEHSVLREATFTELRVRSEELQRRMVRSVLNLGRRNDVDLGNLRSNQDDLLRVQRQAHGLALAELGMSPGTNDDGFLLTASDVLDTTSTATPEPFDLSSVSSEDLEEPRRLFEFDPFTADNIYDREEREGEGRMMADFGESSDEELQRARASIRLRPEDLTSLSPDYVREHHEHLPAGFVRQHYPEFLRNPFGGASDPSRESVIEEATRLAPEEVDLQRVHQVGTPGNLPIRDANLDSLESDSSYRTLPDDHSESVPEAPESLQDRNATPPAISRTRQGSQPTSQTPPILTSPSSISLGLSSADNTTSRDRPGRHRRLQLPTWPPPGRRSHSELDLHYPSLSSSSGDINPGPRHRVTMLSVFPAEMFAEMFAGLFTAAVTLPLDTLYVRSLAVGFLGARGASTAAVGIGRDVYGLHEWLGGRGGRLRYAGTMMLMMGLQGCVSALSWTLVTRLAVVLGRQTGWGQL